MGSGRTRVSSPFTYLEVGGTRGTLPAGYQHIDRTRALGRGESEFLRTAAALMNWDLHRLAGLTVVTTGARADVGVEVVVGLGVWHLVVRAPCRVVYTVDEPRRRGFAYGTLPGHPEAGEELFLVEWRADDVVTVTVRAFSRPALWWSRLGRPIGRRVQARVTERYLDALVPVVH